MKKLPLLVLLFGLMTLPSIAEEAAKFHAFGGYQYFRAGFASGDNMNGFEGAFSVDVARHMAIATDFSTAIKNVGFGTSRITTYTFGPVISLNSKARIAPFAHILIGGAAASLQSNYYYITPSYSSVNYFALKVGGGVDVKVNRLLSIRGFQLDWNYFHGYNASYTDEISAASGVVFNF